MTTRLATPTRTPVPTTAARTLGGLLPGAAGLLFAGVQLDGGLLAAALRGTSTVPEDRLSFPFSGAAATTTSVTWGLTQLLFLATLVAFARSSAFGASRPGRLGAWLAVTGGVVFVVAHAVSAAFRDAVTGDPAGRIAVILFAAASFLTAAGFILSGTAVARSQVWTAWRRWTVLAMGVWMLCLIPLQFTALLPLAVAVYAATIAAFSIALIASSPSPGR